MVNIQNMLTGFSELSYKIISLLSFKQIYLDDSFFIGGCTQNVPEILSLCRIMPYVGRISEFYGIRDQKCGTLAGWPA